MAQMQLDRPRAECLHQVGNTLPLHDADDIAVLRETHGKLSV